MTHPIQAHMKRYEADLIAIRRDFHRHPETAFEEVRTSAIIAGKLAEWGLTVVTGLAGTGVVGTLRGCRPSPGAIGLRADMDALNLQEDTGLPYASIHSGKMHACGHDGHVAMLLGAARFLAETPEFSGIVHFIFQPAEENEGGGRAMVEEGLFERFPCDAVYGLHNEPRLPAGRFGIRAGPMLAAVDRWSVTFEGNGGHGAVPERAIDPNIPMAHFLLGLQTIIGRNVPAQEAAVVSVGHILAGAPHTPNVIPAKVHAEGTARSYQPFVRALLESRLSELANGSAAAHRCAVKVDYRLDYPALINDPAEVAVALAAAADIVGLDRVDGGFPPIMAGEDFAFMLERTAGAFMLIGNGFAEDGSIRPVHSPHFDFNDAILTVGAAYWANLVKTKLPL